MLIVAGDFNVHVGMDVDGYEGIHGGFNIGTRNREGRRLLEFCAESNLVVGNTWFMNRRKVMFHSGDAETQIDFMLVAKEWRKRIQNVKVIPGELQHILVRSDEVEGNEEEPSAVEKAKYMEAEKYGNLTEVRRKNG